MILPHFFELQQFHIVLFNVQAPISTSTQVSDRYTFILSHLKYVFILKDTLTCEL